MLDKRGTLVCNFQDLDDQLDSSTYCEPGMSLHIESGVNLGGVLSCALAAAAVNIVSVSDFCLACKLSLAVALNQMCCSPDVCCITCASLRKADRSGAIESLSSHTRCCVSVGRP